MPNINDLRKQFPGLSGLTDYDISDIYAQGRGISQEASDYMLGIPKRNDPGFWSGAKSGIGSGIAGVGRAIDDMTDDKTGAITRYGREMQQRNPMSEASASWEGFKNNPWQGFKEFAGQGLGTSAGVVLPMFIPGVGEAAGASTLARGTGMALNALKSGAGMTATAAAPMYDQIRTDQEQAPEYTNSAADKLRAGGAALAAGLIETKFGVNRLIGKGFHTT